MKSLSREESSTLINKLRERYDSCARKYSAAWFNRSLFEDRLKHALSNDMDISAFILAEVTNFEKLKSKYENEKNRESFSDKIDKIIEEQYKQLKKYPLLKFHPRADMESSHLYGALFHMADELFPVLWIIVEDTEKRKVVQFVESKLSEFVIPTVKRLAPITEDYFLVLDRKEASELEKEKAKNNYLKETGFLLHDIVDFCESLIIANDENMAMPIQFSKSFESAERKRKIINQFSSLTGFGAVFKIKQSCEDMISDFRLSAFRRGDTF